MTIPRPKILTVITVPSGGWTWDIDLSDYSQYDTNITSTVSAGDYFVSGDNQSDDLLFAFQTSIQAQIDGAGIVGDVIVGIDELTHQILIQFYGAGFVDATGDNDVRLNVTGWSAGLAQALGFDESSDVVSTDTDNPTFTADWQHGYGWYANDEGLLRNLGPVDVNEVNSLRSRAIDGGVIIQFVGDWYDNELQVQFIPNAYMFSDGIRYGAASVYPYERNQGLECWWMEAREGKRFRVYRDGYIATAIAADRGTSTACNTTTLTDAGKAWDIDPQRFKSRLIYIPSYPDTVPQCFFIASHTGTVLTVPNAHPSGLDVDSGSGGAAGGTYYVLDHSYGTYVLGDMKQFLPREIPKIDCYDLKIPLMRYVA